MGMGRGGVQKGAAICSLTVFCNYVIIASITRENRDVVKKE